MLCVQPSAVPENKAQAAGFDYDYYQPGNQMMGKRNFDYDYYNPYALYMQKRGSICLPFGMSCSTKGIPCCNKNVECRCNLFNTNCKCQRASCSDNLPASAQFSLSLSIVLSKPHFNMIIHTILS